MPRRLLQKLVPAPQRLRERWFARLFGDRLSDPRLWSLHRRGVTYAVGAGLAISFVPLPVHLLLACTVSVIWRLNVAVTCSTTFVSNPFTVVPLYYLAYRVGAAVLHLPRQHFKFHPTLEWFRHGLMPVWRPFITGCLVCALIFGVLGWLAMEILWRCQVASRYRARHAGESTQSA